MDYEQISKLYNCKLPNYFRKYFDAFINQYDSNSILISDDELKVIKNETNVDDGCISMIKKVNEALFNNKSLHLAASYFIYVTTYSIKPWDNLMHEANFLLVDGFHYESIDLFFVAKQLAYTLMYKNPPKDLNLENLNAFKGYSTGCYNQKGYWGINEFHWNMQCAGGCMFVFGVLKFCASTFCDDFPMLYNGKDFISLVKGEFFVDCNEALTNNKDKAVFKTSFIENEKEIIAHKISKDGKVSSTLEHFDKTIWKDYLRGGTPTIDIHIPSNTNYKVEPIMQSYKEAIEFYKNYYPDHHVKAIVGFSWLFSPELHLVLNEGSNIKDVLDTMYLMPTLGTFDENLDFIRKGSSLQNRIKEKINEGTDFHFGIMAVPVDEIYKK